MKITYLDNNATTQVAPEVLEAMVPYFDRKLFQPELDVRAGAGRPGRRSTAARKKIAECLGGVDPKEILFTGCATESNNTAIVGSRAWKSEPAAHHHDHCRASRRPGSLQGTRAQWL